MAVVLLLAIHRAVAADHDLAAVHRALPTSHHQHVRLVPPPA
jgi:hypothetical protein